MNRLVFISMMLLIMASGCKGDDDDDGNGRNNGPRQNGSEIQMSASSFLPQTFTVSAGTAVRWVNSSQMNHTVTSNDGLFDQAVSPGGSFVYTFTTPGTYNYVCTIHSGMSGVVIVEAGD